jgi:hypothetical protein
VPRARHRYQTPTAVPTDRYHRGVVSLAELLSQQIGARIFALDIWLSETRNARYEDVCVNDAARLLLLTSLRQR